MSVDPIDRIVSRFAVLGILTHQETALVLSELQRLRANATVTPIPIALTVTLLPCSPDVQTGQRTPAPTQAPGVQE